MALPGFHVNLMRALCEIFGYGLNMLVKLIPERTGIPEDVVYSVWSKVRKAAYCLDLENVFPNAKPVETDVDDARKVVSGFFTVVKDVLGEDSLKALAKAIALEMLKHDGKRIVEEVNKFFGNVIEVQKEMRGNKLIIRVRPRIEHAAKHLVWVEDLPIPILIIALAEAGKDYLKLKKREYKENVGCTFEFEIIPANQAKVV